jgi:hypothetical protein
MSLRSLLAGVLLLVLALQTASAAAPGSVFAAGGNITEVNLTIFQLTPNWQGIDGQVFFGTNSSAPSIVNATGRNVNASNIFIQIPCDNPTSASGFIYFSNSSSPPSGLTAGNLSVLNSMVGAGSDSGSATFTTTSAFAFTTGTITNVPTTYTFVNQSPQNSSFREGYFNQGNDIVFATVIEKDLTGYNTSFFDYQSLLAAPNLTTVPYYVFTDITFVCPSGGGGGGGSGGGGVQSCIWMCQPWLPCTAGGLQQRVCAPRNNLTCRPHEVRPPTSRSCTPGQQPRTELPEVLTERDILTEQFLRNLSLVFIPTAGEILQDSAINGVFRNRYDRSIEDVHFEITTPEIVVAAAPAHPYPRLFWNAMNGWADHGTPTPKTFAWETTPLQSFDHINPQTDTPVSFTALPPVMQPLHTDIGVDAYTGPVRITSARAPFTVNVPRFAVTGSLSERNVLTLYYVVNNRGMAEKDINIELDLNRDRSTLVAEMLGPLHVDADSVAIFGHEYKLGSAAQSADAVKARLYSKDGTFESRYVLR